MTADDEGQGTDLAAEWHGSYNAPHAIRLRLTSSIESIESGGA